MQLVLPLKLGGKANRELWLPKVRALLRTVATNYPEFPDGSAPLRSIH